METNQAPRAQRIMKQVERAMQAGSPALAMEMLAPSTFISDVEITSADTRVNTGNTPATANTSTFVDAKLQQFLEEARAAEAKDRQELSDATTVVENSENPNCRTSPVRKEDVLTGQAYPGHGAPASFYRNPLFLQVNLQVIILIC